MGDLEDSQSLYVSSLEYCIIDDYVIEEII